MYNLLAYGRMISNPARFRAYTEALRRMVKPGSVVLDLGTGPGIMALLACRFGARKVYAIESSPIIDVAREIAHSNGMAEKIEFIQAVSTEVTLPEAVDVIVSDLNGTLPWYQHHLSSVVDARRRFLKPDGVLIPGKENIWIGVVENENAYSECTQPWETGHGFDMQAARDLATNTPQVLRLKLESLLVQPQCGLVLDFMELEGTDSKAEVSFIVTRPGIGHGALVWFDCELGDEISFSNAPGCEKSIYGQTFFPWRAPVRLETGDVVRLKLNCSLLADDYTFRWRTEVLAQGNKTDVKARFDQSDFHSLPISMASLRKGAVAYVPRGNGDASVDSFILQAMDGQASVGQIAARVSKFFPEKFHAPAEALSRVARVSRNYSD